jgi:hypothetical protein
MFFEISWSITWGHITREFLFIQQNNCQSSTVLWFILCLKAISYSERFVHFKHSWQRVNRNQLDAQFIILSIFRQPLHVLGVSRPIIKRYNRVYTTIGTYYSSYMTVCCPVWIGIYPLWMTVCCSIWIRNYSLWMTVCCPVWI